MDNIVSKKIVSLSLVSILCLLLGFSYGIGAGDSIIVIMSIIICVVNLCKMIYLKRIVKSKKYIMISGRCLESTQNIMDRCRTIRLKSGNDEFEVTVPKTVRVEIDKEYNLYFKEFDGEILNETKWLRNKLLSENFLGYEKREGDDN